MGEPGHSLQDVQPPEGRQDHRGGPAAAAQAAVRAAQRHLFALHPLSRGRAQRRVALLPVPGAELTVDAGPPPVDPASATPAAVHDLIRTLWSAGHAAYVVGGSLRDTLLGRPASDWDLATSAPPEATTALFPGSVYENQFGTVAVRTRDRAVREVEITTMR